MDSGEWRYGQADEPPRGRDGAPAGGAGTPWGDTAPRGDATPGGWADEPATRWGSAPSWMPQQSPGPPADEHDTGSWRRTPALPEWVARHAEPSSVPAPALPQLPVLGGPTVGRPPFTGNGAAPVSPGAPGGHKRTGLDTWSRPLPERRRRLTEEDEFAPHRSRRHPFGEEPAYGPVMGYTAGWYGVPALFYLIWLFTLDADRQGLVGRQFMASLPWLLAAIVLSFAVAGLLRWAIIGWRAVTLSFAAAVIGAGVTTIAHSLTL